MEDPVRKQLEKLRAYSASAKRRIDMYSNIAKIDNTHTKKSLNALHNAPSPGKKLQKVGFIMFWVPEPTGVTCALGAPLILAGKYLEGKYNSSTISDVNHQTREMASSINDFKNSLL
jgi:hypothetical protein